MNNSGRNPTRRNKNIGTAKAGHSKDNKLVIPERWADYKIFWERLSSPVICPLTISGHQINLFVEPPRKGYVHASTPQDVVKLLSLMTVEHVKEIENVVFRQPKKKEEILSPVWARFVYYADLGRFSGPGIYLEALKVGSVVKWGNKLTPFYQKELDRLKADGHIIKTVKRGYDIHTSPETVRNTQLFRSLPHEVGHAVDYLTNSLNPSVDAATEAESDYIDAAFNSKPSIDKEEYANRYATEFYSRYLESGDLPFDAILNDTDLHKMGLDPNWFSDSK